MGLEPAKVFILAKDWRDQIFGQQLHEEHSDAPRASVCMDSRPLGTRDARVRGGESAPQHG
jgi:hypothetical protein